MPRFLLLLFFSQTAYLLFNWLPDSCFYIIFNSGSNVDFAVFVSLVQVSAYGLSWLLQIQTSPAPFKTLHRPKIKIEIKQISFYFVVVVASWLTVRQNMHVVKINLTRSNALQGNIMLSVRTIANQPFWIIIFIYSDWKVNYVKWEGDV